LSTGSVANGCSLSEVSRSFYLPLSYRPRNADLVLFVILPDVFFVLGALIIAASYHLPQIIIGRLILGFGVGIASAITPMYIGELAPARFRSRLVTIQSMMVGVLLSSFSPYSVLSLRSVSLMLFLSSLSPHSFFFRSPAAKS
jgi:MFS family permease